MHTAEPEPSSGHAGSLSGRAGRREKKGGEGGRCGLDGAASWLRAAVSCPLVAKQRVVWRGIWVDVRVLRKEECVGWTEDMGTRVDNQVH